MKKRWKTHLKYEKKKANLFIPFLHMTNIATNTLKDNQELMNSANLINRGLNLGLGLRYQLHSEF